MVSRINEIGRRSRSGDASVEGYLQGIAADPVTAWFTDLLREKNVELTNEKQRGDRIARALQSWQEAKNAGASASEADAQLAKLIREMGILDQ
jgi:hypothetical protein